jgi:hypothetical protein
LADRLRDLSDAALERALVELGAEIAYPPTPAIAAAVRARLAAAPPPRRPFWALASPARRLALAALAILVVLALTLALSAAAREAVADRLGLKGLRLFYVPEVPTPTPVSGGATPAPLGERLNLGRATSLAEAGAQVAYPILRPRLPNLGEPDLVFLQNTPPGGQVWLVYNVRAGLPESRQTGVALLFSQFRGSLAPEFLGKGLGPRTRLEAVAVNGGAGYRITGEAHLLMFRDGSGNVRDEAIRLAGNTLVWEQGGLLCRLEAAIEKEEALRIAATVR